MKTYTQVSILDFLFRASGYGHYEVTYTSPISGKSWTKKTNNMPLIDATKNAESPKQKDLVELKKMCKQ